MRTSSLSLVACALLMGCVAQAQTPAAEVQALTARLNQLARDPKPEENTEVLVSLADCGFRQTVRKYRSAANASTTNIAVSNSKKGSSWGVKSNEKVEFELTLSQEWAEVGSITYVPKQHDKGGGRYYELEVKRKPDANGNSSSLTIDLALNTTNEQEVAALVKRLDALRRQCTSRKG